MLKGMYLSATAALNQAERFDILSNNLANTNTAGFKPQRPVFAEVLAKATGATFNERRLNALAGANLAAAGDVFTPGDIEYSERVYDLAIVDEGFFVVERDGRFYYTRAGNFRVGPDGYLVTSDGAAHVLLENGVPIVAGSSEFEVDSRGFVTLIDAQNNRQPLGYLWVMRPRQGDYSQMTRHGDNLWRAPAASMERVDDQKVMQGALEKSSVSAVHEMTSLISAMRAYEAAFRFVKIQDEALAQAVSDLARPLGA
ncbi:MAG TPA: flagellar hook basal-body protein [Planctomycetes bacterium]|nr:flagellar hook basal-body protein [Planctomycetota bacterium]